MLLPIGDLYPFNTFATVDGLEKEFIHYARIIETVWEDDSLKEASFEVVLEPASYFSGEEYAKHIYTCEYKTIPFLLRGRIEVDKIGR